MSKYNYTYRGIRLDPYRICTVYNITHPAHQHALKKILCPGDRGYKSLEKDVREAIVSLERWLEMLEEDNQADGANISNTLTLSESCCICQDFED